MPLSPKNGLAQGSLRILFRDETQIGVGPDSGDLVSPFVLVPCLPTIVTVSEPALSGLGLTWFADSLVTDVIRPGCAFYSQKRCAPRSNELGQPTKLAC